MGIVKDSLITTFTQIVLIPLSMISGILFARSLGPSGKGIYALAFLVPTMIVNFAGLGIGSASVYLLGKKKYSADQIVGNALGLALVLSGAGLAIFGCLYPLLKFSLTTVPLAVLLIALLSYPGMLLNSYTGRIVLFYNVSVYNLIRFFEVAVVIVLFVAAWLTVGISLPLAAWITAISTWLVAAVTLFYLRRFAALRPYWNRPLVKEAVNYGFKSSLTVMLSSLNYRADMFVLGYLVASEGIGNYSIAVSWAEMLWLMTNSASLVLFPKISSLSVEDANRTTSVICRNLLWLSLPMTVLLGVFANFGLPFLYGEKFRPSIELLNWLLPGIWVFTIVKILWSDLAGRGRPELTLVPLGLAAFSNVPINFVLIPYLGVAGASISSTISYTAAAVAILVIFNKATGMPIKKLVIPERGDWQLYRSRLDAGLQSLRKFSQRTALRHDESR